MNELEGLFGSQSFRSQSPAVKVEWLCGAVTRMLEVLGIFFDGYIMVEDEGANRLYLVLRSTTETLATDFPEVEDALREFIDLFPNLYEAVGHPDSPDENWEVHGPPVIRLLKARLSEAVLDAGTAPPTQVREAIQAAFGEIDKDIVAFREAQTQENAAWLKRVRQAAERAKPLLESMGAKETPAVVQTQGDKLLDDEAHAASVEGLIRHLKGQGKDAHPEGTYNWYGERGSVDVYYVEGPPEAPLGLAIYEVWTEIRNLNEAVRKLDAKARVFPQQLCKESGMASPNLVQAHMVLLATHANADLVLAHIDTFRGKFQEGVKAGFRYVLWSFDPVMGDMRQILPQPTPGDAVQPLQRFPNKHSFLNAWRKKRGPLRD